MSSASLMACSKRVEQTPDVSMARYGLASPRDEHTQGPAGALDEDT